MDQKPLHVKVVSADRKVWEGESVNIIVRTTEGDIGLLPGHEPFLAALAPCAAQIITTDGHRQVIALDGGFVALDDEGNVSLITQYATSSEDISVEQAERDRDELRMKLNEDERTEEDSEIVLDETHRLHLAQAQIAAARIAQEKHD